MRKERAITGMYQSRADLLEHRGKFSKGVEPSGANVYNTPSLRFAAVLVAHSSRGLGRRPLTPVTRVRIPYALPTSTSQKLGPLPSFFHIGHVYDTTMIRTSALLLLCILLPPSAPLFAQSSSEVTGRILSQSGLAIEHARITAVQTGQDTFSDREGRFTLPNCSLPCLLLVEHPRFQDEALEVQQADTPTEVTLTAKQAVFEQIDVTASRDSATFAPLSVASSVIRPEEEARSPSTLTELVEGVAGVAENGQGGLFQVFSIRGLSRHRVLTLVSGMPMTSERRAGVSTSFIDPLLISSVDVLRGPFSTYYGSGALGGVAQVFPRSFRGTHVDLGWNEFGNENYQSVGWGQGDDNDGWSLGFAHRTVDDDEAADGTALNNHFTQYSAVLERTWSQNDRRWQLLVIPTLGRDLGKPNSDFPGRETNYPRERHLLVKLRLETADGSRFHVFAHPNDLETEVLRVDQSLTTVLNDSFDFGADWQREEALANGKATARYGINFYGRRGVEASESVLSLEDGSLTEARTLRGAEQNEAAIFGSLRWGWGAGTWQAGTRWTWNHQQNGSAPSEDDTALTAFLGAVYPLGNGVEFTANVGTGLRFPNLSERFFTGTTGRGQVIGNPNLDSEQSLNMDLGLRWYGEKTYVSLQAFRLDIDDYIERIDLPDDTRTFVNLNDGTLEGVELEGFHQWTEHWQLRWNGHLLTGEDDDEMPLADIPADRFSLGLRYERDAWSGQVQWQFRDSKDDPGSGEIPIPSAQLVSASLSYQLQDGLTLSLRGRNLLDEEYFNSADDKISPAPGRSLGLSLSWSRP